MAPERPDIFSWVLKYFEETPKTAQAKLDVEADAYLIVVAGSDTTSCTLATLFFHLAQSPTQIQLLRQEIDPSFNTSTTVPDFATLAKSKHLDGLINEALRLHPPVPSGVQRVTPANGLSIGGTWIPGKSIVSVPLHTIFRDPRNFKRPTEFIPERWTTQPDLVPNPSCFIPFLTGAYSCPGKQLAFMELRYVTAQIVHKYDVSLAPDQTAEAFVEGKRDTFTLVNERLNLVFTPRKI